MNPTLTFHSDTDFELRLPVEDTKADVLAVAAALVLRYRPDVILRTYRLLVRGKDERLLDRNHRKRTKPDQ